MYAPSSTDNLGGNLIHDEWNTIQIVSNVVRIRLIQSQSHSSAGSAGPTVDYSDYLAMLDSFFEIFTCFIVHCDHREPRSSSLMWYIYERLVHDTSFVNDRSSS